jgi:hypothetical protein
MFNDIFLHSPDFLIRCNSLVYSADVYSVMRKNYIYRSYAYAIAYNHPNMLLTYQIIKIGQSSPDPQVSTVQIGERISRQIHHVPGWKYLKNSPISSHGQDFMNAVNLKIKENLLPNHFNKNDITIGVWDISKRMSLSNMIETPETERRATMWAEGELANQHKQLYGKLPMLNFADPTNNSVYKNPNYISKTVGQLFGW